jgi:hypothetical protein
MIVVATIGAVGTIVLATVAVVQMRASRAQSRAALDAVARQVQPLVFAHERFAPTTAPEGVAYHYYLKNEGPGIALNILHGVEIKDRKCAFEGGQQFRTARPGEYLPPIRRETDRYLPSEPLQVFVPMTDLQVAGIPKPRIYWTEFDDLFGQRWELRNPADPTEPAKLRALGARTITTRHQPST